MQELIARLRNEAEDARDEAWGWGALARHYLDDGDGPEVQAAAHYANLALDLEAAADALERQQATLRKVGDLANQIAARPTHMATADIEDVIAIQEACWNALADAEGR